MKRHLNQHNICGIIIMYHCDTITNEFVVVGDGKANIYRRM